MYTQCPDCQTAFRVTAAVLQQAGGRVRCGSCGHAFSALERLSEDPPQVDQPAAESSSFAVEDRREQQEPTDDDRDALLDTLNELAGADDIRIEDTGVEWLVIDDDSVEEAPEAADSGTAGPGTARWHLNDDDGDEDDGSGPVDDDAQLPEVLDQVPLADAPDDLDGSAGIQVEESGIQEIQEPLDLPTDKSAELRFDDYTPLPEEFDDPPPAAAVPDVPQRRAGDQLEPRPVEFDERQSDLALGEPEDWRLLLDEFAEDTNRPTEKVSDPDDIDTQFDLQALELGIDVSGNRQLPIEPAEADANEASQATSNDSDLQLEVHEPDAATGVDLDPDSGDAAALKPKFAVDDFAWASAKRNEDDADSALEAELLAAYTVDLPDVEEPGVETSPADDEHVTVAHVPPQTEEEMTINMQIDQDLLRLAEEDAGFALSQSGQRRMPQDSLLVETIIMEGDFVRTALDKELDEVVKAVADSGDDDPRRLLDTYISKKEKVRGGRRKTDPPGFAVVAGIAVLGLALLAQATHNYRDSLATYGAFNQTVGAAYRWFGDPLVPAWDVRGWRFESTSGSTEGNDEILTIRSRVSNQSSASLPYPLLHISLTDRYEEIIGSKVLQPAAYLSEGTNFAQPVAAGDGFTAVITVASLAREATGFKLNICYRETDQQLRCATEDFRH
ncbi:MAG: DUF3426 domain-containing protein [Woeseia sp.]